MVKELLDQDRENTERLQPAYEELALALTKAGTAMYVADEAGGSDAEDEITVEGEFHEVGSEG